MVSLVDIQNVVDALVTEVDIVVSKISDLTTQVPDQAQLQAIVDGLTQAKDKLTQAVA